MNKRIRQIFAYRIKWSYLLLDICLLALIFFVILQFFPLSTPIPFKKYKTFILVFSVLWVFISYCAHRYVSVKFLKLRSHFMRLFITTLVVFLASLLYDWAFPQKNLSFNVILCITLPVAITNAICLSVLYAYKYALNIEPELVRKHRSHQQVLYVPEKLSAEAIAQRRETLVAQTSENVYSFLQQNIDINSSNTLFLKSKNLNDFKNLDYYRYDTIVNLERLNHIRGINKMFGIVNDKLPDNSLWICCFEPKSTRKRRFLAKYPPVINYILYSFDFLFMRVMPNMFATSRLFFDITGGRHRVLSKTEVLGRLCYCGFEIAAETKQNGIVYVVARRAFTPKTIQRRVYGAIIRLKRIGKNGKEFDFYKMRTMYPYSEYLQSYIYEKNRLQEGGKFNHDIRITSMGRFMRRFWIDEWPMVINLLKGDMKLVGVRPISKQYFSLYSKELQEKRIKFKPGLLPPFYADMPKTLEEIQASEMKYLTACEQKGVFLTDITYFCKILYNIIFRCARSK